MSMKARVRTDANGDIVVHMEGGLDFENTIPFKSELEDIIKNNPASSVTIDMTSLDFVGSSGINYFIEAIQDFNQQKDQIRLTNVKKEFVKVFKLYQVDIMSLIVDDFDNDDTEIHKSRFNSTKRTFAN